MGTGSGVGVRALWTGGTLREVASCATGEEAVEEPSEEESDDSESDDASVVGLLAFCVGNSLTGAASFMDTSESEDSESEDDSEDEATRRLRLRVLFLACVTFSRPGAIVRCGR